MWIRFLPRLFLCNYDGAENALTPLQIPFLCEKNSNCVFSGCFRLYVMSSHQTFFTGPWHLNPFYKLTPAVPHFFASFLLDEYEAVISLVCFYSSARSSLRYGALLKTHTPILRFSLIPKQYNIINVSQSNLDQLTQST